LISSLLDLALDRVRGSRLENLVIGASYIIAVLDDGRAGLMVVPYERSSEDCTLLKMAGSVPRDPRALARMLLSPVPIEAAVGAAVVNALVQEDPDGEGDLFDLAPPEPGERVVFVGYFRPYIEAAKEMGCRVYVIERQPIPYESSVYPDWAAERIIPGSDYVVITGSTLYSGQLERYLSLSGGARVVAVVGPSTPMARAPFRDTPATYLMGSRILDAARAAEVVAQGGGTRALVRSGAMEKVFIKVKRD